MIIINTIGSVSKCATVSQTKDTTLVPQHNTVHNINPKVYHTVNNGYRIEYV